jgi:hypothetical protein
MRKATPLDTLSSGVRHIFARVEFLFSAFQALKGQSPVRPASDTCHRAACSEWDAIHETRRKKAEIIIMPVCLSVGRPGGCCCNITGTHIYIRVEFPRDTRPRAFLFNSARQTTAYFYSNKNSDCKIGGGGSCASARASAVADAGQIARSLHVWLGWFYFELLIALILCVWIIYDVLRHTKVHNLIASADEIRLD